MSKVRAQISVSADGYVAGPNQSKENPLGEGGESLHDWVVALKVWRDPHGREGGEVNESTPVVEEALANVGAEIMGRGKFGGGPGPWGEEPWLGWWGEDPPFHMPVFVLTHHAREPLTLSDTTFTFVTNGIESALEQAKANVGAEIMGRGMFGGGPGPWPEEPWNGWWGDDPPFHMPVFVLTHHEREPLTLSDTTFTFVTDGIESALEQAKAAAAGKDVHVSGGAEAINQYLAAGLVDELELHVVPLVLGGGAKLFEGVSPDVKLEQVRSVDAPGVTHLKYRVAR